MAENNCPTPNPCERIEARIDAVMEKVEQNGEDIRCLSVHFRKYQPMLDEMSQTQRAHDKLRQAIIEKSVIGIVWGAIVLVGVSLWNYVRHHI